MSNIFKQIVGKCSTIRGFSTFESILLVPAISLLIFGALDVSRLLQAYSALDEGVNESLRCIFPTDGDCSYNEDSEMQARFNFYSTTPITQWLRQRNRFVTEVSWLKKPLTTFSGFKPIVLGELNYTIPPTPKRVRRETPAGSMLFHHLIMQANGPHVVNPNTPDLNYNATNGLRFVFGKSRPNRSKDYPATTMTVDNTLALNSRNNSSDFDIIEVNVPKLPDTSSIPCYRGERFNNFVAKRNRQAQYGANCNVAWLPFAFYLKGRQLSSTGGKISIYAKNIINQDMLNRIRNGKRVDLDSWLALGGQTFLNNRDSTQRDANFVPRGVRRWTGDFDNESYPEYGEYSKLFARPGKKIEIKLVLERSSAGSSRVSWRATELITFSPVMSYYKHSKRIECLGSSEIEKCKALYPESNFEIPNKGRVDFKKENPKVEYRNLTCNSTSMSDNSAFAKVGWANCSSCRVEENPDKKACLGVRDKYGEKKTIECISGCNYDDTLKNCTNSIELDELNSGVESNPNIIGTSAHNEARLICDIPSVHTEIFSFSELGAKYKEYEFVFPNEQFVYERKDCNTPKDPALPLKYSRFKNKSFNSIKSSFVKHEDKNTSPEDLKATNLYSCFEVENFVFDSTVIQDLPENSMFNSEEFYTCDCEKNANKKVHHDSAYKEKFSDLELFSKTVCLLTNPVLVSSIPGDVCPVPIPWINQTDDWQLVEGGPYLSGQIPDVCKQENISCKSEFLDYIGGKDTTGAGEYENKALNIAYNATNTLAPWISSSCNGKNTCSKFEIENIGDSVTVSGSVEVPLTILGNYKIPISVSGNRKEERHF